MHCAWTALACSLLPMGNLCWGLCGSFAAHGDMHVWCCMQCSAPELQSVSCRRGVHAMGGMAAQIPIKNDDKANNAALEKVGLLHHHCPMISAEML